MAEIHEAHFRWPSTDATHVVVTGTFDNWAQTATMTKTDTGFEAVVKIPFGETVLYKFIVDGNWVVSPDQPQKQDGQFVNNIYIAPVKPIVTEAPPAPVPTSAPVAPEPVPEPISREVAETPAVVEAPSVLEPAPEPPVAVSPAPVELVVVEPVVEPTPPPAPEPEVKEVAAEPEVKEEASAEPEVKEEPVAVEPSPATTEVVAAPITEVAVPPLPAMAVEGVDAPATPASEAVLPQETSTPTPVVEPVTAAAVEPATSEPSPAAPAADASPAPAEAPAETKQPEAKPEVPVEGNGTPKRKDHARNRTVSAIGSVKGKLFPRMSGEFEPPASPTKDKHDHASPRPKRQSIFGKIKSVFVGGGEKKSTPQ